MESLPKKDSSFEDLQEISSGIKTQTFEESEQVKKTATFQTQTVTTTNILQTQQLDDEIDGDGEKSFQNRMLDIVNDFQVVLSEEDDEMVVVSPNHISLKSRKVYLEQIQEWQEESKEEIAQGSGQAGLIQTPAQKGSGQDTSLVPQSAKSGKSDELRIKAANTEQDQFSLEGNSELYLKEKNILELAAIGQNSLLQLVKKGIKHFEILRDPNDNRGYEEMLDYLQSLKYERMYVILTFENNEKVKITRFCSTFSLSHLSFQLRLGPVKEKFLNFLSILAKNQQQTIIDATGMSNLTQEQLLIICRRMEMHGHKELKTSDYIGKNEEEIKEFYNLPIIENKAEFKTQYSVKTSNSRIYIFKPDHYVIKTPKQTFEETQGNISRTLSNLLVEQQMIQVVAYNDANILTQMSEVIVFRNSKFIYYLAYKPLYELYEEIRDPTTLLRDSVLLASYLTELHLKTRLYHGDIKPANIFMYPYGTGLLRTDSDTLVSLFHKTSTAEEVYQVKSYTKGYASEQLVSLLENAQGKVLFNQQFLLEEDFRQFKTTVMEIFRKVKSSRKYNPLLYQFMDQLVDPQMKTVEQFFDSLLFSPNFFKDFIIFLRDKNNYSFSKGFQSCIPMLIDHTIKEKAWFLRNKLMWDTSNTHYRERNIDQDLELNLYFIQDLSYELAFKQRHEEKYEEAMEKLISLRSKREGEEVQITRGDMRWLDKLREINKVHMYKLVDYLEKKKETEESVQEGKENALKLLRDFAIDSNDPKQHQLRLMIDSLIFTLWRTITSTNLAYKTLKDRILIEHIDFVYTVIEFYKSDDKYKSTMLKHFKVIIEQCFHYQKFLPDDCMKYTV